MNPSAGDSGHKTDCHQRPEHSGRSTASEENYSCPSLVLRSLDSVLIAHHRHHIGHQFQHRGFALRAELRIRFEQTLPRSQRALGVALALQPDHAQVKEGIRVLRLFGEGSIQLCDRTIDISIAIET